MEGNKVLLLTGNGILEERDISTGLSNWDWTEVTGGLAEDQEVVLSVEREGVADGVPAVRDTQSPDD
jgi:HlyD family secretion protein